jgi:hypothetical protein
MRSRILGSLAAFGVVGMIGLCAAVLVAQTPSGTKDFHPTTTSTDAAIKAATAAAEAAAAAGATYKPPRTAWGDPDLRGYYLSLSYTPLERPKELANKPYYTKEEAVAAFKKAVEEDAEVDPRTVHYDWKEYGMDAWQSPIRPNLRTGLVIDPPDGRIPALTEEGRARARAAGRGIYVPTRGLYERCVTGNQGPPRVPGNHDAESQLQQTPGYVILVMQSNSDVRIIPLDGRPHLPPRVRSWLGDSRGRWEGNTLVIETTNFHPERIWRGSGAGMTLVERLTPTDPQTLKYEFTVTDPSTYARPWTVEVPWPRIEPPLYEFACHEQNYGVMNVVKGAQIRAQEAASRPGGRPARPTQDDQ